MLIDTLKEINEGRAESGRGSKAGREKFASKEGTQGRSVKAKKSRVKVYDTIDAALNSGASYGTIFSTKAADRLYVISKPTWGSKSRAGGNTRIAKGFTPGSATPNATWPSIKSHAVRTMIKHGNTKAGRLTKKYGPGRDPDEGKPKKKKLKEANYPKKSKKLAEILPLLTLIKRKLMEDYISLEESRKRSKAQKAAKKERQRQRAAAADTDTTDTNTTPEKGGGTPTTPEDDTAADKPKQADVLTPRRPGFWRRNLNRGRRIVKGPSLFVPPKAGDADADPKDPTRTIYRGGGFRSDYTPGQKVELGARAVAGGVAQGVGNTLGHGWRGTKFAVRNTPRTVRTARNIGRWGARKLEVPVRAALKPVNMLQRVSKWHPPLQK